MARTDYGAILSTKIADTSQAIRDVNGTTGLIAPADWGTLIRAMRSAEDYENALSGLEQKTVSGSIVSFTDGIKGVPVKSLIANVDPVQDLHGYDHPWVGGAGKNKLNPNATVLNAYVANATIVGNANNRTIIIPCLPNTTYTYTWNRKAISGNDDSIVASFTSEPTIGSVGTQLARLYTTGTATFTTGESDTFLAIKFANITITTPTDTLNASQLELGSTATAYEPYSNICPISGFSALNVTRTGVNLWDEQWEVGYIGVLDGINSSSQVNIRSKNYIPIKPNVSLYLKANIATVYCPIIFYDKDKNFLSSVAQTLWNRTITTPENAYYMRFYMHDSYGTTYNNDISINYPSSDTEYHAYNGQTATVNFGQTVYGGTINLTTGLLEVDWVSADLSQLSFTKSPSGLFVTTSLQTSIKRADSGDTASRYIKSSHFNAIDSTSITGPQGATPSPNGVMAENVGGTLYFNYTDVTTIEEFKTAMQGVNFIYELADPPVAVLTKEEIKTFLGGNTFYADTGDVEVVYYANANLSE